MVTLLENPFKSFIPLDICRAIFACMTERRIFIGGNILFDSILNIDVLFVPPFTVTKDWMVNK
jgi:hypothetical protein